MRIERKIMLKLAMMLAILGLWGCASTGASKVELPIVIKKGMTSSDLVELIGEPLEVRSYEEKLEGAELWVYKKSDIDTEMVSTDLEERIYIDPISGRERTVFVNVMNPETRVSETKTVFLVVDGSVEAWKVEQDERSYL